MINANFYKSTRCYRKTRNSSHITYIAPLNLNSMFYVAFSIPYSAPYTPPFSILTVVSLLQKCLWVERINFLVHCDINYGILNIDRKSVV